MITHYGSPGPLGECPAFQASTKYSDNAIIFLTDFSRGSYYPHITLCNSVCCLTHLLIPRFFFSALHWTWQLTAFPAGHRTI